MIFPKLFFTFLRIGAFTFGGGYAMLPLIEREVLSNGWMTLEEIVNFIAISESTPGPFAINSATFVGKTVGSACGAWGGLLGAFCATLGVVLPSFVIILLVARFYMKFRNSFIVRGMMTGLKPTVIGLLASAVLSVGISVLFPSGLAFSVFSSLSFWVTLVLALLCFFLALKKKAHPILLIVGCAAVGLLLGYTGLLEIASSRAN